MAVLRMIRVRAMMRMMIRRFRVEVTRQWRMMRVRVQ